MRIELHKLEQMFLIIPTIGIDIEYRCVFVSWFNRVLYLGEGRKEE